MKFISQTLAAALIATIAGVSFTSTQAEARGGKPILLQTYNFKKPMHGYSGHAGNYYCDYQRLPQRRCDASGQNCKIVGWTLQQICQ
jgi:hypothetical protein